MKQAIEEGYILNVLANYMRIDTYYKLIKKTENDSEFDSKKAQKALKNYVEGSEEAIEKKTDLMISIFMTIN